MSVKLTRKTNNLEKFMERIQSLSKHKVQSGYFKESGKHSSGYGFAELMSIHENGMGRFPARPLRSLTTSSLPSLYPEFSKALNRFLKGNISPENLLNIVGEKTTDLAKGFFGSPMLPANNPAFWGYKGFNSPLIDSGELMKEWSWKNSIEKKVTKN